MNGGFSRSLDDAHSMAATATQMDQAWETHKAQVNARLEAYVASVPGCPPDAETIFYVLAELAQGRKPELKDELLHWH